jgi:hypothetical protein
MARYTPRDLAAALGRIAYEALSIEDHLPSLSLAEIFAALDGCDGDTNLAAKRLIDMHSQNMA